MSLLAQVVDRLTKVDIRFALIGAGALAAHGVTRSTFDLDFLATDPRCLQLDTWAPLPEAIDRDVRRGDLDDPMAGLVRFSAAGERDIDLVVGRAGWQNEILGRSRPARLGDAQIPIVQAADLILLKLYAGGSQDVWDIEQLLAGSPADWTRDVQSRLAALPGRCARLWNQISASE